MPFFIKTAELMITVYLFFICYLVMDHIIQDRIRKSLKWSYNLYTFNDTFAELKKKTALST